MIIERRKIKDVSENLPENDKALLKEHLLFIFSNMPTSAALIVAEGYSKKDLLRNNTSSIKNKNEFIENLIFWKKARPKVFFEGNGGQDSFVDAVATIEKSLGLKENIKYSLLDLCERWSSYYPNHFYEAIIKYFPEDIDTYIYGKRTNYIGVIPLSEMENIKTLFDFFLYNQAALKRDLKTSIQDYYKGFSKQFNGIEKTIYWKKLIVDAVPNPDDLSYIWKDKISALESDDCLFSDVDIFQLNLDIEKLLVAVGGTIKKSFLNTRLQEYVNSFINSNIPKIESYNSRFKFEEIKVEYLAKRKNLSIVLVLKKGSSKTYQEVQSNFKEMVDIFKVVEKEILEKTTRKTQKTDFYIDKAITLLETRKFNGELSEIISNKVIEVIDDENLEEQEFKL